jgi:hexokinase
MTGKESVVSAFIRETGIGPDSVQPEEFIRRLQEEMTAGLKKEPSSLAMIPTWFSCSEAPKPGSCAIAVDFGGTNFRTALVRITEDGAKIEQFQTRLSPGKGGPMEWTDFIRFLADSIRPYLSYTRSVAICICFPTTITPERDGIIHYFTKEIDIRGYEGRCVGADLKKELGMPDLSVRAINDTTAVLLSALADGAEASGILGIILGTGTNICCQIDHSELGLPGNGRMIVAMETGGFVSPDCSAVDLAMDRDTIAPGVYLEEKKVAGGYLGRICTYAFRKAAEEELLEEQTVERLLASEEFSTPAMDAFGMGTSVESVFRNWYDAAFCRQIARAVFARSAKHIALSLAAVMDRTVPRGKKVTISLDGSVFKKSALFQHYFYPYVMEYCHGWQMDFVSQEEATIIGTAIGAVL